MSNVFKLRAKTARKEPDTIVNASGTLQINVYPLTPAPAILPEHVYLYGDDRGDPIVFEICRCADLEAEAAAAIHWYATRWLFHPSMKLRLQPVYLLN